MNPRPIPSSSRAFQAVTLRQLKKNLHLESCDSDDDLNRKINQLIEVVESDTNYSSADREFTWHPFLVDIRTPLWHRNPTSITSITYIDPDGNQQTIDAGDYFLDLGRVIPEIVLTDPTATWPSVDSKVSRPFTVTYRAGPLEFADVPPEISIPVIDGVTGWWTGRQQDDLGNIYNAITLRTHAAYP